MPTPVFQYVFSSSIPIEEVESSLLLAVLGVESLHGETAVRLSATHHFDIPRRTCVIDTGTQVGHDLNHLFVGFVRREFGEDAFHVARVATSMSLQPH